MRSSRMRCIGIILCFYSTICIGMSSRWPIGKFRWMYWQTSCRRNRLLLWWTELYKRFCSTRRIRQKYRPVDFLSIVGLLMEYAKEQQQKLKDYPGTYFKHIHASPSASFGSYVNCSGVVGRKEIKRSVINC